jgi:hypothetical protein
MYKTKYLKYKNKYLILQKMIGQGLHEDLQISGINQASIQDSIREQVIEPIIELVLSPRENMTKHIEEKMPKNIFEDGKLRIIELKYKDIKLDIYIKNNTFNISAFSRGHLVRKNPQFRIMHAPALTDDPASSKGDGAIFLALVIIHCSNYVSDMEWSASSLSTWWYIKGVCEKLNACIHI